MALLSDYFHVPGKAAYLVSATKLGSSNTGAATLNVPAPDGVEAGDLLVLIGISRNSYFGDPEGGGWTEVCDLGVLGSGGTPADPSATNDVCMVWYRRATSSEPATYGVAITDDGTDAQVLHCLALRNAGAVSAYDALGAKTSPSVDLAVGDALLCFHGTSYSLSSDSSVNEPDGMVLVNRHYESTNNVGGVVCYEPAFVAGASGTRLWVSAWDGTDSVISLTLRVLFNP